jgi:hypothetical protein
MDAAATVSRTGRAVVYPLLARGVLLRFLSEGPAGLESLEQGTLSVAVADGDGVRWAPLPPHETRTGEAAQSLGPLRLEGSTTATACGRTGRVLIGTDSQVLALTAPDGDHAAERYGLSVVQPTVRVGALACTEDGQSVLVGTDREGADWFAPDTLSLLRPGGAFRPDAAIYRAPRGAGIGGAAFLPDGAVVFMVRRPGFGPQASFRAPGTRWPTLAETDPPRTTLVLLQRGSG